jgi:hypothetical protein
MACGATLRRLLYKVATAYGEYSDFKARIEKDTGLWRWI